MCPGLASSAARPGQPLAGQGHARIIQRLCSVGLPMGKGMCAGWLGSRMGKTQRGCLAASVSNTCPARDEDAIKWPKLCIHFPLDLQDFIFMLYIFISYIFI